MIPQHGPAITRTASAIAWPRSGTAGRKASATPWQGEQEGVMARDEHHRERARTTEPTGSDERPDAMWANVLAVLSVTGTIALLYLPLAWP